MPIKVWEVYELDNSDPEDAIKVQEWDAEDAARAVAEKMDMRGDFSDSRTLMVREVGTDKWMKYETTAEMDIRYSARAADE